MDDEATVVQPQPNLVQAGIVGRGEVVDVKGDGFGSSLSATRDSAGRHGKWFSVVKSLKELMLVNRLHGFETRAVCYICFPREANGTANSGHPVFVRVKMKGCLV